MSDLSERLGRRIRGLREAAGLSQEELAFAAGVSRVHLSALERGTKSASVETCARVAGALRVTLSKLLDFESSAKAKPAGPAERFALRMASYAEGATPAEIERAEKVMRLFFDR